MEKLPHLAGVGANEQNLFHGTTDEATARCICCQNFDPRVNGRNATLYGKGTYFSTKASYSHKYTQPCPKNNGQRFMFFARVLVGKSTLGKPEFQRPPPVDSSRPHGALFDSCVSDTSNPAIFAVFDNAQCYPEFLILYESLLPTTSDAPVGPAPAGPAPAPKRMRKFRFFRKDRSGTGTTSTAPTASSQSPTPTVPASSAAATKARPTSLPAHQPPASSTTGTRTSSHATPVKTAHSAQPRPPVASPSTTAAPPRRKKKCCIVL